MAQPHRKHLLTSVQMAHFVAYGSLRLDAVVPDEMNTQSIDAMKGGIPAAPYGTPLSEAFEEGSFAQRLVQLPEIAGAIYSLVGPEAKRAVEAGFASADWFRSDLPRERMKHLMRRSDYPAVRDTAIWLGGMVLSGALGVFFWGGWLALPFFLVYGVLYGSASEARSSGSSPTGRF
jgi:hypothetical protein